MGIEERYADAVAILADVATPEGFVAARTFGHYDGIWTRDAGITALGALAADSPGAVEALLRTVRNLAARRSPTGMVPNAFWPARDYWDWGEAGALDAQCWFLVMVERLVEATGDDRLADELWPAAAATLTWLRMQDVTGFGLVSSVGAADWMDSTFHRSGIVLHDNVLFVRALEAMARLAARLGRPLAGLTGAEVARRVDLLFWPTEGADYVELLAHVPYPRRPAEFGHPASVRAWREAGVGLRHYLSHVTFGTYARACDVLANLLAIVWGVADAERARSILAFLDEAAVAEPFPSRTYPAPVTPDDDPWELYHPAGERAQDERWRNPPHAYHNAGAWPVIGGFHVAALVAAGRDADARTLLARLAEANAPGPGGDPGFPEWRDGRTGAAGGARGQAWSAAGFVLAYRAVADGGSPAAEDGRRDAGVPVRRPPDDGVV